MLPETLSLEQILERLDTKELTLEEQLDLLKEFKVRRINNASARKAILRTILTQDNLSDLFDEYRNKIRSLLQHAWGQKQTGILKSILRKSQDDWNEKEARIFDDLLGKYLVSQRARKKMISDLRILWQ